MIGRSFLTGFLALGLASGALAQEMTRIEADGTVVRTVVETPGAASRAALAGGCTTTPNVLCLRSGRFLLDGTFTLQDNQGTGPLTFSKLTDASGTFYFSDLTDAQGVIKVLDVCGFAGAFWVFIGALTDQEVHLRVIDTYTGAVKRYDNALKNPFLPVYDFSASTGCGAIECGYSLSASSGSFNTAGGGGSVNVVTGPSCAWNAVSNASFVHVNAASTVGTGNAAVTFTVDANSGSARSGTLTVAGQTFTVNQSGTSSGSQYDGSWSGTSSQGKAFSFTVVNGALTTFKFGYSYAGGGCSGDATTELTFSTPRAISGTSFTISSIGSPGAPFSVAYTINGTFSSASQLTGTFSVNVTTSFPNPSCSASGSGTWSASKQ